MKMLGCPGTRFWTRDLWHSNHRSCIYACHGGCTEEVVHVLHTNNVLYKIHATWQAQRLVALSFNLAISPIFITLAGWAMQVASYIFLKRQWEKDEAYLTSMIDYLSDLRYTGQILIFPEGKLYTPCHKFTMLSHFICFYCTSESSLCPCHHWNSQYTTVVNAHITTEFCNIPYYCGKCRTYTKSEYVINHYRNIWYGMAAQEASQVAWYKWVRDWVWSWVWFWGKLLFFNCQFQTKKCSEGLCLMVF